MRIQDDLYTFVNKEWIDHTSIPDDDDQIGAFAELTKKVNQALLTDLEMMSIGKKAIPDVEMKQAVLLYQLAVSIDRRNSEGIAPVVEDLTFIDSLMDVDDFNAHLADLFLRSIPLPFNMDVESDRSEYSVMRVMLWGPHTILPDICYYKPDMAAQKKELLNNWKMMVNALLEVGGFDYSKRKKYIDDALAFDELVALFVKSSEEWGDYVAAYNAVEIKEIAKKMNTVELKQFLDSLFSHVPEIIMVAEPRYFENFHIIFSRETFSYYKHWAYILHFLDAASYLDIKKQAFQIVSDLFPETIGAHYCQTYFAEGAKADVSEMAQEMLAAFKERIRDNGVFSASTKDKAICKLEKIIWQIGYPDKSTKIDDYLQIDCSDSLYQAVSKIKESLIRKNLKLLDTKMDRTKWGMATFVVDADYDPTTNTIVLPAAILQPPFYSVHQSRSQNLGGIGTIIGHELTHALDINGAKYDENGCVNNWWNEEDLKHFYSKARRMVKQAEEFLLPLGEVNGELTINENIADNGGMAIALHVMRDTPNADYAAFFSSWARIWREKLRAETLQQKLLTDEHAPGAVRVNMQPRNFPEWYETYPVDETDFMYLAPEKRVIVW